MLKKLLEKMGLNTQGKVVTGEEAKKKITSDQNRSVSPLTEQEINFILTKLRTANYNGAEFEMFHSIWMKLTQMKG